MKPPFLSTGEFAALHDVEPQTVVLWAKANKLKGAFQTGGRWLIPRDAERPEKKPTGRRPKKG